MVWIFFLVAAAFLGGITIPPPPPPNRLGQTRFASGQNSRLPPPRVAVTSFPEGNTRCTSRRSWRTDSLCRGARGHRRSPAGCSRPRRRLHPPAWQREQQGEGVSRAPRGAPLLSPPPAPGCLGDHPPTEPPREPRPSAPVPSRRPPAPHPRPPPPLRGRTTGGGNTPPAARRAPRKAPNIPPRRGPSKGPSLP